MAAYQSHESKVSPVGRLAAMIRARHWASFLLELSLIVVGILIALYIDAWMQDREDRKAELSYLELLNRDLDQINETLQVFLDFETENATTGAAVLQMLANDDYRNKTNELRAMLWKLSWRRSLRLSSAAYTDLISTGNLQLIQSRPLRNDLLQYFADIARTELVVERNNSAFVDQLYHQYLHDMGIAWSPEVAGAGQAAIDAVNSDFFSLVSPDIAIDSDDLFASPLDRNAKASIRRMIVDRTRFSSIGRVLARSLMERTAELKAAFDDELASR